MLQITDAAVSVFKAILSRDDVEGSAIRIEPVQGPAGETLITFEPVKEPREGDQTGQATDLEVFVAPEIADSLSTAILDVAQTDQGPGLVLRSQV
jgi:Fe-S cluster assembly iron-binding protein IscA